VVDEPKAEGLEGTAKVTGTLQIQWMNKAKSYSSFKENV
jgi:hypothetical protein